MTRTIVVLLLSGVGVLAQTNAISFTNSAGMLVTNAEPVRVEHSKLIYRTPGGGGGIIRLSDLPRDLQARFGYDPVQAAADEQKEKEQIANERVAAKARAGAFARAAEIERRKKAVEATGQLVYARVIQRIGDKLLVDASGKPGGDDWKGFEITPEAKQFIGGKTGADYWNLPQASGTILVVDYPRVDKVVDGDGFVTVGYPIGTYEYTAVSGGKKTIRKYTARLDKAILGTE